MKRALLIILIATAAIACTKSKQTTTTSGMDLTGKWNLVLVTGGLGGIHETAAQWGHSESYLFRADNTFTHTVDASTTPYPAYTLFSDTVYGGSKLFVGSTYQFNVKKAHDTLTVINQAVSDATTMWFVKQ